MAVLAIALLAALALAVVRPFFHSNAHLVIVPSGGARALGVPPIGYLPETVASFDALEPTLRQRSRVRQPLVAERLGAPADLARLQADLKSASRSRSDVLIVYVAAPGVSHDSEAYLVCDNYDPLTGAGLVRVADLLQSIDAAPAHLKLVVFETGASRYDPRMQMILNEFPSLLDDALVEAGCESTWILNSHSLGELSHVCRMKQGPVFSLAVRDGLAGEADTNQDEYVSLGELHAYVRRYVAAWVDAYSDGEESQTPQLIAAHGNLQLADQALLIPVPEEEEEAQGEAEPASPEAGEAGEPTPLAMISRGVAAMFQQPQGLLRLTLQQAGPADAPAGNDADAEVTDAGGNAEANESGGQAEGADPEATEPLREMLKQMWRLRDQLESREQVASPVDRAPYLWRRYIARLERLEQLAAAGREQIGRLEALRLRRSMAPLYALLGQPPPDSTETLDQLGADIAAAVANGETRLSALHNELRRLVDSDNREPFDQWLNTAGAEQLADAGLGHVVRWSQQAVSWDAVRNVLATRLAADEINMLEAATLAWIDDRVQKADRLRITAERGLIDGIEGEQAQRQRLARAAILYAQAKADANVVTDAHQTHNELVFRLPYYLRFRPLSGPGKHRLGSPQDLTLLLELLNGLADKLMQPATDNLASVGSLVERLRRVQSRVEQEVSRANVLRLAESSGERGASWRMRLLLGCPLLDASSRETLAEAEPLAQEQFVNSFEVDTRPEADTLDPGFVDWDSVRAQCRLELAAARLCERDLLKPARALAGLSNEALKIDEQSDGDTVVLARRVGSQLQAFYRDLPFLINDDSEAGGAGGRDAVVMAHAAARLIDARDALQLRSPLARQLRDADLASKNTWQRRRLLMSLAYATADERRVAERESGFEAPPLLISLDSPATVDLSLKAADELTLKVANRGAERKQVWIVADYDHRLLTLEPLADRAIYGQRSGAARGDRPADQPTLTVDPGQEVRIPLRLTRSGSGFGETRLAFKLVGAGENTPAPEIFVQTRTGRLVADPLRSPWRSTLDYERRVLQVGLPLAPAVVAKVDGQPGSWLRREDGGLVLHPFPNRPCGFRVSLVNQSAKALKVDVRLAENADALAPPVRVLNGADARQLLARIDADSSRAPIVGLELPPEVAVPAPFPDFEAEQAEAEEGADKPPPSTPPMQGDLLLLITDQQTGQTTVERISFRPQRPRRYVRARASYRTSDQKVSIRLTAKDPLMLPAEGAQVRAHFEPPLPPGRQAKLGGVITGREATLEAEVPRDSEPVIVAVDVDDFPRAFLFKIDPSGDIESAPEWTAAHRMRIVSPEPNTTLQAPTQSIAVEVQVDAPVGSFVDGGDFAEIGIDRDRDGEFRSESPMRLTTDRQAKIRLVKTSSDGGLVFHAQVSDFQVDLPARGIANQSVNLLGRLVTVGRESRSAPVRVRLDSTGPRITLVAPASQRAVAVGGKLKVEFGVTDDSGAGVEKVEAALDVDGKGRFTEDRPPAEATFVTRGVWAVEIDAADVTPGVYSLLVRATDRVGNQGGYTRVSGFRVISAAAAEKAEAKTSKVAGVTRFGSQPAANITMSLKPLDPEGNPVANVKTDRTGRFVFPAVAAGQYQLEARGVIRNNGVKIRAKDGSSAIKVTVKPPKVSEIPPITLR